MSGAAHSHGARRAGRYLAELLLREDRYRSRWVAESDRLRAGQINFLAVAKVLAAYAGRCPGATRGQETCAKEIKDIVRHALLAHRLSWETLQLFIGAFDITDVHAVMLRQQWEGSAQAPVIIGDLEPPDEVPGHQPPKHETLMLHEHHWLGSDGLPARHRTQINIRSCTDGFSSYQYRCDTPKLRVKTVHGCQGGAPYRISDYLWAVDLTLPRPLARGDVHYMEFWTLLKYDVPPPTELRRGTHGRTEHIDLRVQFDHNRQPSTVWWAEWEHYQGNRNRIIDREVSELDGELSVHKYLEAIERAVVGFYWEW